jgi:hypothetical protein
MLEIPDWVPPAVAAIAREMHGSLNVSVPQLKIYADTIERLACDGRIRRVWQELQKKHRSGYTRGLYLHAAIPEAVRSGPLFPTAREHTKDFSQVDQVQYQALVILFVQVANLCSLRGDGIGPHTRTAKEATREIVKLRTVARRIRTEAEELRDLRLGYLSPPLEDVAKECAAFADMHAAQNDRDVLIVSRNRSRIGGPWERGFVISVAYILEHLFGQKMQSLVAVLANVALEKHDITESRVNGVFRSKGVS